MSNGGLAMDRVRLEKAGAELKVFKRKFLEQPHEEIKRRKYF